MPVVEPDVEIPSGSPIAFQAITPLNSKIIQRQIKYALSLGLPEADGSELSTLNIVANGPSARGVKFQGPCLALNGALKLFPKDRPPQMWAACDPQGLVADFLTDAPKETTYIVASKCHPSVFRKLKDRDVRLWHINDQPIPNVRKVPCAVSVTLCAMMLAQRLGWRRLEIWGWDCSFAEDGSHHATEQASPTSHEIDVMVGDQKFRTLRTWACEVNDAMGIIPVLEWCGVEINIHGEGMLSAIRNYRSAIAA